MTINVFEPNQNANTVETLVGEGKKYATVDDLANAYINADTFIERLKSENNELRTDLTERETAEQILQRTQRTAPNTQESPPVTPAPAQNAPKSDDDDFDARFEKLLNQSEQRKKVTANVTEVTNRLIQTFGDEAKANEVVTAKAAELGVTPQDLQEQAARSPKAFYKLIGLDEQHRSAPGVHPELNTAANRNGGPQTGTYAYYKQLRKDNPNLYRSPKIQNQMHLDAQKLGEAFFN